MGIRSGETRKIVGASLASLLLCATLAGCGQSQSSSSDSSSSASESSQSSASSASSSSSSAASEKKAEEKVTASDVSIETVHQYNGLAYLEDQSEQPAYMLKVTLSNPFDYSVDVSISVNVTMKYSDNYGDPQTVTYTLDSADPGAFAAVPVRFRDEGHCTYVGLAPKETKQVIYLDQSYAYDLGKKGSVQASKVVSLSDPQIVDIETSRAECTYVPVSEWQNAFSLVSQQKDVTVGEHPLVTEYNIAGTLVNDTDDRWRSGGARLLVTGNGIPLANRGLVENSFSYEQLLVR